MAENTPMPLTTYPNWVKGVKTKDEKGKQKLERHPYTSDQFVFECRKKENLK